MNSSRNLLRLVCVTGFAVMLVMGVFSKRGWLDWRRMAKQNLALKQQIVQAEEQVLALEHTVKALETSPFAQEQAVRQHLGYMRSSELAVEQP